MTLCKTASHALLKLLAITVPPIEVRQLILFPLDRLPPVGSIDVNRCNVWKSRSSLIVPTPPARTKVAPQSWQQ
jgi:hypothetical protein